jgi:hypothetical protein
MLLSPPYRASDTQILHQEEATHKNVTQHTHSQIPRGHNKAWINCKNIRPTVVGFSDCQKMHTLSSIDQPNMPLDRGGSKIWVFSITTITLYKIFPQKNRQNKQKIERTLAALLNHSSGPYGFLILSSVPSAPNRLKYPDCSIHHEEIWAMVVTRRRWESLHALIHIRFSRSLCPQPAALYFI